MRSTCGLHSLLPSASCLLFLYVCPSRISLLIVYVNFGISFSQLEIQELSESIVRPVSRL